MRGTGFPVLPNEVRFLHTRFRPIKSKNSKLLSDVPCVIIPDEYCCPLSGDIMENPVYDIRAPQLRYDEIFLQYWIGKSYPKLVPHTQTPYNKDFLKVDFDLKIKITNFVKKTLEEHAVKKLEATLLKFKLPVTQDKSVLNQALRRAAMCGTHEDLSVLFSFAADVNARDENPEKMHTALHWALLEKKFLNASTLIYSGAKICIKSAKGITPLDLILKVENQEEKENLLFICKMHGLIDSVASNNASLFHQQTQQQQQTAVANTSLRTGQN